jgi:hypothetical protein
LSIAILAFVGQVIFTQIAAFVAPSPSYGSSGHRLRSRVRLAASKAEIDAAKQHADLLQWAASTAAEKGLPAAVAMQAKADSAVAALEALKAGDSVPVAAAPATVAPAPAVVPAASSGPSREAMAGAEKHVQLLLWAAKTAAEKGLPAAAAMQAKADHAAAALAALKAGDSAPVATTAVASAPVAPVAPTPPVVPVAASKAEIAEAERQADLLAWAARTAAEKGLPQALKMQQMADEAQAVALAMKSGSSAPSAPAGSAPVASTSAAPTPCTAEELAKAKNELELFMWAAKTAEAKGMQQAATLKAKADDSLATYKQMEMAHA